jgi:GNAT superfamily N-acetyltransferase
MSEYPERLVVERRTRLGGMVRVRPIRPEDAPRLLQFHEKLSARSIYLRYFYMHPNLSPAEVDGLTRVDYVDRLAFVVEDGEELIAVARYERTPGTDEAEVAFLVADAYQHHGIGTLLLEALAEEAWRNGIRTFLARTLPENRAMLDVFVESGFAVATNLEDGEIAVRISIEPTDTFRAAYAVRHAESPVPVETPGELPSC